MSLKMSLKKGDEVRFEGDYGTTNGVVAGIVSQAIYKCRDADGTIHNLYENDLEALNKRMTGKEARIELKKMAKGDFYTISYEISEHTDGEIVQECSVYINGKNYSTSPTWEQALQGMRDQINPPTTVKGDVEAIEEF